MERQDIYVWKIINGKDQHLFRFIIIYPRKNVLLRKRWNHYYFFIFLFVYIIYYSCFFLHVLWGQPYSLSGCLPINHVFKYSSTSFHKRHILCKRPKVLCVAPCVIVLFFFMKCPFPFFFMLVFVCKILLESRYKMVLRVVVVSIHFGSLLLCDRTISLSLLNTEYSHFCTCTRSYNFR